jgi:hypothetical protein
MKSVSSRSQLRVPVAFVIYSSNNNPLKERLTRGWPGKLFRWEASRFEQNYRSIRDEVEPLSTGNKSSGVYSYLHLLWRCKRLSP